VGVTAAFVGDEAQGEGIGGLSGAMLDGEGEVSLLSPQIEVGVSPGMQVSGAAEALSGLCAGAAVFARVVDDEHGDIEIALQGAEIAEDGGDLPGVILVDAVEADEGVEDEQSRRRLLHGGGQSLLIASSVDAHGGRGDDVDG